MDAETDRLSPAERYERTEARKDTRAGSYQPQTRAGEVTLDVPKLRTLPFETAIIDIGSGKLGGRSSGRDLSCWRPLFRNRNTARLGGLDGAIVRAASAQGASGSPPLPRRASAGPSA